MRIVNGSLCLFVADCQCDKQLDVNNTEWATKDHGFVPSLDIKG